MIRMQGKHIACTVMAKNIGTLEHMIKQGCESYLLCQSFWSLIWKKITKF